MIGLIFNFIKSYKIVILAGVAVGLMALSGYGGYKLSEASWLKKQVALEVAYRDAQEKAVAKLSVRLRALENKKQERKVVYREKIKYIKSGAPDCNIDDARLRELQCLASPSKCSDPVSGGPSLSW